MTYIRGTDIPVPIGCNEWTLISKFDFDDITPDTLERLIDVRVGRDYHGSAIHEQVSPFSAIYDLDGIQYIISVCGWDYLAEYVDPRTGGNIMHALAVNPNVNVMRYVIEGFGEMACRYLINSYDNNGRRVIELTGYNKAMFGLLLPFTSIESDYAEYLIDKLPVAKSFLK